MTEPILQLHHPRDARFGLEFLTDDREQRARRASDLSDGSDLEIAIVEERVDGETVHLIYTKTPFEVAYPDFESTEEVLEWFDRNFSPEDKQILLVVVEVFDGIISEREDRNAGFSTYKRMEWETIPDVLNRVQWRQSVPEVGAELLSYFVLGHPLSNTNHRTAIGLLDRYLASYEGGS